MSISLLFLALFLAVVSSRHVVHAVKNPAVETKARSEGDVGLTGSQELHEDPSMLGRKSVLMGMLTSGFVIANAAQPSDAIAGGTIKPIAATQPISVPRWTKSTTYVLGQQVISPNNDVVSAKVAHTSSATYASDTPKWALSSTYIASTTVRTVAQVTQAQYDALGTPDPATLYVIVG